MADDANAVGFQLTNSNLFAKQENIFSAAEPEKKWACYSCTHCI
jgi:hypothetical protein